MCDECLHDQILHLIIIDPTQLTCRSITPRISILIKLSYLFSFSPCSHFGKYLPQPLSTKKLDPLNHPRSANLPSRLYAYMRFAIASAFLSLIGITKGVPTGFAEEGVVNVRAITGAFAPNPRMRLLMSWTLKVACVTTENEAYNQSDLTQTFTRTTTFTSSTIKRKTDATKTTKLVLEIGYQDSL